MNGMMLCRAALEFFEKELPNHTGNYLEIGVYDGLVISTLAQKFPDRQFYGVDPFIEDGYTSGHNGGIQPGQPLTKQKENAISNLVSCQNAKLFVMPSIEFRETTDVSTMDICAVLIDGNHHAPHVDNDFRLAIKALTQGGIMYVDDLYLSDVTQACLDFFAREFTRIERWEGCKFWIKPQ